MLFSLLAATALNAAEPDGVADTDSAAIASDGKQSEWVNMRCEDPASVMKSVWTEINFRRCLEDYRTVSVSVADSLESVKKPDETAVALFLMMLLCWLVNSFVIKPLTLKFKKP